METVSAVSLKRGRLWSKPHDVENFKFCRAPKTRKSNIRSELIAMGSSMDMNSANQISSQCTLRRGQDIVKQLIPSSIAMKDSRLIAPLVANTTLLIDAPYVLLSIRLDQQVE